MSFSSVQFLFAFLPLAWAFYYLLPPRGRNAVLAVFSLGIGMILAAMAVFFRDVIHLWEVFTTILMWFSAIFYTPEQFGNALLEGLIALNPLYQYITAFRDTVMYGQLLSGAQILICAAWALVMLALGLFVFKKTQDKFVLYM